ncbi:MAG: hypothetical protein H6977_09830 [Gammaproteobacteria bacterium]|nr:hypothetical protein [Gammaproteobacteria bacterium]MCP5200304.1 hypothetical protein [Gammaproteobacteria bacterium]
MGQAPRLSPAAVRRPTVGVLFNHDALHQVSHVAPVITGLREVAPDIEVTALTSSPQQQRAVTAIVGRPDDAGLHFALLDIPGRVSSWLSLLNTFAPARRLYILKRYHALLSRFDCLLVPETTSIRLKTWFGVANTRLVLLPHGAGDRAIGFGREIRHFDHVLVAGTKIRQRMLDCGVVDEAGSTIVGYPKFDLIDARARAPLFDNDAMTVLYNPHFDPDLSSWYDHGLRVLDYFADNPQYNLVFAPHVMLYRRRLHVSMASGRVRAMRPLPTRFLMAPNIRVDLGSENCVNMRYTLGADFYLGDVSSQVYEFLFEPRPCAFINSHAARWEQDPNYRHWHNGPVIDDVAELDAVLRSGVVGHAGYRAHQRAAFAETFDISTTPSATRAARAIAALLTDENRAAVR